MVSKIFSSHVPGIAYFALIAFLPAFWLYYLLWKPLDRIQFGKHSLKIWLVDQANVAGWNFVERYYNKAVLDVKRISKVQSSPVAWRLVLPVARESVLRLSMFFSRKLGI